MASSAPDLAGFADAQRRLRTAFGENIVFLGEVALTFPGGVALDPETGLPYDPTAVPTASAQASATVRCNVVAQPGMNLRREGEDAASPFGVLERGHIILIADISDKTAIAGKTHAIVRERRYLIASAKPDGIGGVQRILVSCREEGLP